jgi:Secretion system C-terminal sorting domain
MIQCSNFSRSIFFILAFCLNNIAAFSQYFGPVDPQNMQGVINEIYTEYGADISISQSDMFDFLTSIQTNYDPTLDFTTPTILSNTNTSITFHLDGMADAAKIAGVLNTNDNSQSVYNFTDDTYTFSNLNDTDLYLFAFATGNDNGQSTLQLCIVKLGFIIITDDKILLYAPCDKMILVGNDATFVTMQIGYPADLQLFKIEITPCVNSPVVSDIAYMWFENVNSTLRGILANKTLYPENMDNDITGVNKLISTRLLTGSFSLTSLQQVPGQSTTSIKITKLGITPGCVNIRVTQCKPKNPPQIKAITFNTIYPNPASDFVLLQMPDESLLNGKVTIYNSLGKSVKTIDNLPNDVSECEIDIHDLPNDMYVISVFTASGMHTFKMIKSSK